MMWGPSSAAWSWSSRWVLKPEKPPNRAGMRVDSLLSRMRVEQKPYECSLGGGVLGVPSSECR